MRAKALIRKVLQEKNASNTASVLRQAAKDLFMAQKKELALDLIEFALNFAEQSNQYFYCLIDWFYYKSGIRVNSTSQIPSDAVPPMKAVLPWLELEEYLQKRM